MFKNTQILVYDSFLFRELRSPPHLSQMFEILHLDAVIKNSVPNQKVNKNRSRASACSTKIKGWIRCHGEVSIFCQATIEQQLSRSPNCY